MQIRPKHKQREKRLHSLPTSETFRHSPDWQAALRKHYWTYQQLRLGHVAEFWAAGRSGIHARAFWRYWVIFWAKQYLWRNRRFVYGTWFWLYWVQRVQLLVNNAVQVLRPSIAHKKWVWADTSKRVDWIGSLPVFKADHSLGRQCLSMLRMWEQSNSLQRRSSWQTSQNTYSATAAIHPWLSNLAT